MPISLIDNFNINTQLPIDGRMVASNSTIRDAISYKYDGMKVFLLSDRKTYIWNQGSSSWDIDGSDASIPGTPEYVAKWNSSSGLTVSSIISLSKNFNEVSQKIGIGGTPVEAFQINGNYDNSVFGTSSLPFVVHKGPSTVIGENWYHQIGIGDKNFESGRGSSTIEFLNGSLIFKGRTANSGDNLNTYLTINTDSTITLPSSTGSTQGNGSISYNVDRFKVKENGEWKNVTNTYKSYITLVSQSGTSSPTENLLETNIGSGTWSYVSVGTFRLTITNGFVGTVPQISGFCGPYTSTAVYFGSKINDSVYEIRTLSAVGAGLTDSVLLNTPIEIKVW